MSASTVFSLPYELLVEILALVASSSLVDLLRAKISCKAFNTVAEDTCIYKRVSIEELPVGPWVKRGQISSFLRKCRESGNVEALYRQGVGEYFNYQNLEKGLEYIKSAANSGHDGASYILGVILICEMHDLRQGMRLLCGITKSSTMRECRKKFKDTMKYHWRNKKLEPKSSNLCKRKKKIGGWSKESESEEEVKKCEECRCNWEVTYVCNLLQGWNKYKY